MRKIMLWLPWAVLAFLAATYYLLTPPVPMPGPSDRQILVAIYGRGQEPTQHLKDFGRTLQKYFDETPPPRRIVGGWIVTLEENLNSHSLTVKVQTNACAGCDFEWTYGLDATPEIIGPDLLKRGICATLDEHHIK